VLLQKARQVFRLLRKTNNVFQVREFFNVFSDVCVERLPVSEDEDDVNKLLIRVGLEQAVQPVRKPADDRVLPLRLNGR
jgi:hypothetical protein